MSERRQGHSKLVGRPLDENGAIEFSKPEATERLTPERINDYLQSGGLFNPEAMEHATVRGLLMDCRDEIRALRSERDALQLKWECSKELAICNAMELRGQAAASRQAETERCAKICEANGRDCERFVCHAADAAEIRATAPSGDELSALKAEVRLDEAEWWLANTQSVGDEAVSKSFQRITNLRAICALAAPPAVTRDKDA